MSKYINNGTCISMGDNCRVNGITINKSCNNIIVSNGKVWIDGKEYTGENGELENKEVVHLTINVEGDLRKGVESDCELEVNVNKSIIGNVRAGMSTTVQGNVEGDVRGGMNVTIQGNQKGSCRAGMNVTVMGNKVFE